MTATKRYAVSPSPFLSPTFRPNRAGREGQVEKVTRLGQRPHWHVELVAQGVALRDDAMRRGYDVNESCLVLHRVLSRAFAEDLGALTQGERRTHLSVRYEAAISS